jgi:uncharacterized protein YecT (DUF1311 family)
MNRVVAAILVSASLFCCTCYADDAKLRELEERLTVAKSQTELNIASRDIAEHVEKRLAEREAEMIRGLDAEGARLFRHASDLWRAFRSAQVASEGDFYRGGTIQPLIRNSAFIRITKERIKLLSELKENGAEEG